MHDIFNRFSPLVRNGKFHDKDEWPSDLLEDDHSMLVRCHELHVGRTEMLKNIKNGLRETKGRGQFRFDMRMSYNFMDYLVRELEKDSDYQLAVKYHFDKPANYVKIVFDNGIVSVHATKDVVVFTVNDVRFLENILGATWYMAPLLDPNATVGDVTQIHHSYIPHLNPEIRLQFDMDRLEMKMQVPFVSRRKRSEILAHQTNFRDMVINWQEVLTGLCVFDPDVEDEMICYEVILVEVNHIDFVSATSKKGSPMSCVVAWLLPYNCYEFIENPMLPTDCRQHRDLMLETCIPFAPQDVEEFVPIFDDGE